MQVLHSETLVRTQCWCGIWHAVPDSLHDEQQRQHNDGHSKVMGIYCPLGHTHIPAGESECKKLRRRVETERADADRQRMEAQRQRERANTNERRRAAQQGATTKLKKRVAAGVCPCCNRSFKDLLRHMAGQHPEYGQDD